MDKKKIVSIYGQEYRWLRLIPGFVYEAHKKLLSRKVYILSLLYLPTLIFALTFPLLPERYWIQEIIKYDSMYLSVHFFPPTHISYFVVYFAMGIYGLTNLTSSYIQAASRTERKQVKFVFLGLSLLSASGLVILFKPVSWIWAYWWSILSSSFLLPVSYAVVKYKLMVTPVAEEPKLTKQKYVLEPSFCYLVKENISHAYGIFTDLVMHEVHGLLLTRMHPKEVREKYGLVKTPIVWLGNYSPTEDVPAMSGLEEISLTVDKFANESKNSVILIDGIEYLINQHDFRKTLRFVYHLKEIIGKTNSRLLIPVDPKALDGKEVALLEREMKVIA